MLIVRPVQLEEHTLIAVEVHLPKTTLIAIQTETGYVMCGALDIQLLREKLGHRKIIAARAVGVKNIDELLCGTVDSCTEAAEQLGICQGMQIREALLRMRASECTPQI